jgi:hypothetical protein
MPDGYQWPTDKIDVQMYAPGEQFVDRSWSACDTVLDYLRYPLPGTFYTLAYMCSAWKK